MDSGTQKISRKCDLVCMETMFRSINACFHSMTSFPIIIVIMQRRRRIRFMSCHKLRTMLIRVRVELMLVDCC